MKSSKARLDLKKGWHTLKGTQAVAFARARTGEGRGDGSDLGRLDRQHEMIAALVTKITSENMLTNSPSLYNFLSAGTKSLSTSPGLDSVQDLAGLALSLRSLKTKNVVAVTIPYAPDPANAANVVLAPKAKKVFDALAEDTPVATALKDPKPKATASGSPAPSSSPSVSAPAQDVDDDVADPSPSASVGPCGELP
jgi:anionic cell wall polymer biosynthesis LytR-Cps2A-Psr (LCP) family protein